MAGFAGGSQNSEPTGCVCIKKSPPPPVQQHLDLPQNFPSPWASGSQPSLTTLLRFARGTTNYLQASSWLLVGEEHLVGGLSKQEFRQAAWPSTEGEGSCLCNK